MEKIIKMLLFFLILALPFNIYATSSQIKLNIPSQNELTEDHYLISVDITDNPGFASLQVELFYNSAVLTCERVIPGEVVKGMLTDSNPKATGEKTSAILSVAGVSNTTENGNLATFVFEKPKSGNPQIEFALVEIMTFDGEKVECETKITDNYGEFEEQPEVTPPTENEPTVIPPSDEFDDNDNSSGSTASRPSYSGGGGSSTIPEQTVIHDEIEKSTITFADITGHWASEYITEAVSLGIVSGMPDGTFQPDKEMTRAEFATLLWNMAEKPDTDARPGFDDVTSNDWFYKQIAWAFEKGYINGTSETEFYPNGTITREQAMTILYRYTGSPDSAETLEKFEDKTDISDFALSAMHWAVEEKIISGVTETEIAPKASATRAQLATIMVRYLKQKLILGGQRL